MVLMAIFAVGLPLWLLAEEVLRLRADRSAAQERTAHVARPVGVVLSQSRA